MPKSCGRGTCRLPFGKIGLHRSLLQPRVGRRERDDRAADRRPRSARPRTRCEREAPVHRAEPDDDEQDQRRRIDPALRPVYSLNTICSTPSENAAVASARYSPRSRSAGNAITAPTSAVATHRDDERHRARRDSSRSCPTWWKKHRAADPRERHRGEAHLARVPDEQHERQDDDRRPRARRST